MRRKFIYPSDGSAPYEVPVDSRGRVIRERPAAAVFLGDKTLERQMAAQGKVRCEEMPYVQQDRNEERKRYWERQKADRKRKLIDAAKRHTNWL